MIEWRSDNSGLFSNLMRVVEWIYCVKEDPDFGLYVNMHESYNFKGNAFSALFKQFEDSQIITELNGSTISYCMTRFPAYFPDFKKYATDGMKTFSATKYVYGTNALFIDPDFSLFRKRLHPIILYYLKPVPELEQKIDLITQHINHFSSNDQSNVGKPITKIGIHVRCLQHYVGCNKTSAGFLDDVEKDIDQIMASKDPKTTVIFLATLIEPLIGRLCAKYNIVISNIPRSNNVVADWTDILNEDPLDMARDAIVDTWCLAQCDELWCASSNMAIFAACLNPSLKMYVLPSLKNYGGA